MVTEEMLKNAAVEVERALLQALGEEAQPHEFSAEFEKKIKRLTRRAEHPVRYRMLRYAAVVILVLATLFGTVMAASPDVRAAVVGWFRTAFYGPYAHYDNVDVTDIRDAAAEMEYDYYLSTIPEGYAPWREMEKTEGKTYMYHNESTGNILFFDYAYAKGVGDVFLNVEGYSHECVRIGSLEGDLYTTTKEGESNVLVWSSKHGGVLFEIMGDISGEQLIALAESVQYKKAPVETKP